MFELRPLYSADVGGCMHPLPGGFCGRVPALALTRLRDQRTMGIYCLAHGSLALKARELRDADIDGRAASRF